MNDQQVWNRGVEVLEFLLIFQMQYLKAGPGANPQSRINRIKCLKLAEDFYRDTSSISAGNRNTLALTQASGCYAPKCCTHFDGVAATTGCLVVRVENKGGRGKRFSLRTDQQLSHDCTHPQSHLSILPAHQAQTGKVLTTWAWRSNRDIHT